MSARDLDRLDGTVERAVRTEGQLEHPAPGETAEPHADTHEVLGAVRMRDIARVAGVSQSTVSRVLNKRETPIPIAIETR